MREIQARASARAFIFRDGKPRNTPNKRTDLSAAKDRREHTEYLPLIGADERRLRKLPADFLPDLTEANKDNEDVDTNFANGREWAQFASKLFSTSFPSFPFVKIKSAVRKLSCASCISR